MSLILHDSFGNFSASLFRSCHALKVFTGRCTFTQCVSFASLQVSWFAYRSLITKNGRKMKFDNPVYSKTAEDLLNLKKHQYQPAGADADSDDDLSFKKEEYHLENQQQASSLTIQFYKKPKSSVLRNGLLLYDDNFYFYFLVNSNTSRRLFHTNHILP